MNNSDVTIKEKYQYEFMLADFKELNSKLDSTDKKMSTMLQVYVVAVTAILTANNIWGNDKVLALWILILLAVVGVAITAYSFCWRKMHSEYVQNINLIRGCFIEEGKQNNWGIS